MTHTKWIVLPLVAATVLGWSGFLDRLEATTLESTRLAEASEEAPESTARAAEETAQLPAIARLTGRQADAFGALADALGVSAKRVFRLNASLGSQAANIRGLLEGIRTIRSALDCVEGRIRSLLETSRSVPDAVRSIRSVLVSVERAQRRSIRHLKSINRKLTALGVVARATNVKAPAPPDVEAVRLPRGSARPIDC